MRFKLLERHLDVWCGVTGSIYDLDIRLPLLLTNPTAGNEKELLIYVIVLDHPDVLQHLQIKDHHLLLAIIHELFTIFIVTIARDHDLDINFFCLWVYRIDRVIGDSSVVRSVVLRVLWVFLDLRFLWHDDCCFRLIIWKSSMAIPQFFKWQDLFLLKSEVLLLNAKLSRPLDANIP